MVIIITIIINTVIIIITIIIPTHDKAFWAKRSKMRKTELYGGIRKSAKNNIGITLGLTVKLFVDFIRKRLPFTVLFQFLVFYIVCRPSKIVKKNLTELWKKEGAGEGCFQATGSGQINRKLLFDTLAFIVAPGEGRKYHIGRDLQQKQERVCTH